MKEYIVSVLPYDGHRGYFVGESETTTIDAPISCWSGNSFHVARRDMARLLFSDYPENAKRMTRKNLMNSTFIVVSPFVEHCVCVSIKTPYHKSKVRQL